MKRWRFERYQRAPATGKSRCFVELGFRQSCLDFASLTPLRVSLAQQQDVFRCSFTAGWSVSHSVELVFPSSADVEMQALLEQVSSVSSRASAPRFDFSWKVLEGSRQVGEGSGLNPITGSFGGGSYGLSFG